MEVPSFSADVFLNSQITEKPAVFGVFVHRKLPVNSVFLNKIPEQHIFLLHTDLKSTIMYLSKDKLYHCLLYLWR